MNVIVDATLRRRLGSFREFGFIVDRSGSDSADLRRLSNSNRKYDGEKCGKWSVNEPFTTILSYKVRRLHWLNSSLGRGDLTSADGKSRQQAQDQLV